MKDSTLAIKVARSTFAPSKREACHVCGQWQSITQAHHVRPLAWQIDSTDAPDHSHVWLCPTHHVALHVLLAQAAGKRQRASAQVAALICDIDDMDELQKLLDLMKQASK